MILSRELDHENHMLCIEIVDRLLSVLKPFISEQMKQHLKDWPDDAHLRVAIESQNGYCLNLTLGDLQRVWDEVEELGK